MGYSGQARRGPAQGCRLVVGRAGRMHCSRGKKGICASVWESLGCRGSWTKRNVLFLLHKGLP